MNIYILFSYSFAAEYDLEYRCAHFQNGYNISRMESEKSKHHYFAHSCFFLPCTKVMFAKNYMKFQQNDIRNYIPSLFISILLLLYLK